MKFPQQRGLAQKTKFYSWETIYGRFYEIDLKNCVTGFPRGSAYQLWLPWNDRSASNFNHFVNKSEFHWTSLRHNHSLSAFKLLNAKNSYISNVKIL